MKNFNGKAIYNPSGKAGEYSYWACNFYVGCSNGCEYCYCKKGILAGAMGQDKPQLKKCFYDKYDALSVFEKEVTKNLEEVRKHGIFFSFTTDPMLPETKELTIWAISYCIFREVPVKILTKCTDWIDSFFLSIRFEKFYPIETCVKFIAFGFTLTGHDELEKGASTNIERIKAIRKLHEAGFKTWASIEPILYFDSATRMIELSMEYCDLYKIGLMSGSKPNVEDLRSFVSHTNWYSTIKPGFKIYWKDSISKFFTTSSWTDGCCVQRDFNIFNQ